MERTDVEQVATSEEESSPEADGDDSPVAPVADELVEDEEEWSDKSNEGEMIYDDRDTPDGKDPRTKVLTVLELEDLFVKSAPPLEGKHL
jgi:large subunit GTPase 1